MKRIVLITFIFLCALTAGFSQKDNRREGGRLETYKIAYLTKNLNLSVEEAQKFWPVYYKYVNELRQAKMQNRNLDEVSFEEKIVNIRKRYRNEFGHALPPERINQFFKADRDFNNYVRKELQERREMKQMRQRNNRLFKQN